jgi:hypothetical protein
MTRPTGSFAPVQRKVRRETDQKKRIVQYSKCEVRALFGQQSHANDRSGESCRAILAFSPLRYGPSGLLRTGVDLQEATSEPACAGHADRPGIRVAEYYPVISQWLPLWPREIDSAPRSCCGYVKRLLKFSARVVEKLSNALREGRRPKKSKGSA